MYVCLCMSRCTTHSSFFSVFDGMQATCLGGGGSAEGTEDSVQGTCHGTALDGRQPFFALSCMARISILAWMSGKSEDEGGVERRHSTKSSLR